MANDHKSQKTHKRKMILRTPAVLTRAQDRNLTSLIERLRAELTPQTAMEEFLIEKLAIDIARLARLYEHDREILQGTYQEYGGKTAPNLTRQIVNGNTDPFLRYKNAVEKDIKDGYSALMNSTKTRVITENNRGSATIPSQNEAGNG